MTSSKALQILKLQSAAGEIVFQFSGAIDESASDALPAQIESSGVFDLGRVERVSSLGAAVWIRWLQKALRPETKIIYRHISPSFVRVLNSLPDMLPTSAEVESFYVPYSNESGL